MDKNNAYFSLHPQVIGSIFCYNRRYVNRWCIVMRLLLLFGLFFLSYSSFCQQGNLEAQDFFHLDSAPDFAAFTDIDAKSLCRVADNTKHYLANEPNDNYAVHSGKVFNKQSGITLTRVKQTLAFICEIYHQDKKQSNEKNAINRLSSKQFLIDHFDFYRWQPDINTAKKLAKASNNKNKAALLNKIPKDKILLTKYYTKLLQASAKQTKIYNQALYALPYDEQELSLTEAEQHQATASEKLTRYKYTRQQIINGALANNNLAKPLVWVTEDALHDILLQGTGVLTVEGKTRYFNVHRNNGIKYDYTLGKREQARYWYFIEVPDIMGYGTSPKNKIALKPYVAFAGNVAQLGLGKLLMVSYEANHKKQFNLAILADHGGAFDNNLFQLDQLVGSYYGWKDYYQANKHLPDYAKAWLLLLKSGVK